MNKSDIKSMLPSELEAALAEMGEPKFRAKQIFTWLMRGATDFASMTNIGKSLQQKLDERFYITAPEILRKQVSKEDGTIKYLWKLGDGNAIESVLMRYKHANSVCVSSQVGCRMNCAFCASAHAGWIRNLTASEILDQVLFAEKDSGAKVSNIVLMGIGEPLDNFDNVIRFLELVNHPDGMNIGMRHISLSTCGLPDKIDKLGDYNLQLTLSLSLHAPDDKTRAGLMPVGRRYPINEIIDACKRYFDKTGRRISIEYAMIDGVNDSDEQAEMLARIALLLSAHINLIPLNNVDGSPLKPSKRIKQFIKILQDRGANVTVRRRLGGDIEAACGQLRKKYGIRLGLNMNGWGITDIGTVRSQNQDHYGLDFVKDRDVALCVVCDGMGGANAGNVASSIAVEAFMDHMRQGLKNAAGMAELSGLVRRSASYANSMVYEVARSEPEYTGMGTTLVGALVMGEYASIINVGDSRAYHITPEGILRITKDHSLVEDMIDRGDLTREEAVSHPDRNLITRALGVEPGVLCDLFEIRIRKGECLLLCTDGLTNCLDEKVIWETVALSDEGVEATCRKLIDLAIKAGATDNVTAVLLQK